ncbi:hypothetical protein CVT26_001394 [Gymnopilus dilepis]|uniref:Uncharacterized protein n=1 Tax=Gymnopilus dilepis TaxID=231916 RepID=A0A409W7K0_9AGAR|nr:hypothetical protein CVT26_001394 [Gymnopilus dilepis]
MNEGLSSSLGEELQDDFDFERTDRQLALLAEHITDLCVVHAHIGRIRNQHVYINRLPFEILARIFGFSVYRIEAEQEQPTVFPLILGRVCHRWRSVAWASPELWASFHCQILKTRCSAQALLLQEWLERSQQRPLSIRISFQNEDAWIESTDSSPAIIEAILPHCERWQSLDLILPKAWYDKLNEAQGRVSNLISLSIRSPGTKPPMLEFHTFETTTIRHFFASRYCLDDIYIRWDLLETVVLQHFTTREGVEAIRRCKNVISCRLTDLDDDDGIFPGYATNTSLRTLNVSVINYADLGALLDFLILPELDDLTVTLPNGHSFPLSTIEAFMRLSICPLKTITIEGVDIDDEDLADFIKDNDSIRTVRVKPSIY